jgi:hypothetical protein
MVMRTIQTNVMFPRVAAFKLRLMRMIMFHGLPVGIRTAIIENG